MDSGLIVVTGGARSGKSSFAESLLRERAGEVLYVATAMAFDEEMKDRISKHRQRRPVHWRTLEAYAGLGTGIRENHQRGEAILLDCLTIMISNLLLDTDTDFEHMTPTKADQLEELVQREVSALLNALRETQSLAVVVTNEVGWGLVPSNSMGRFFRDVAGRMNQLAAAAADEVYLVVCGLPVRIK